MVLSKESTLYLVFQYQEFAKLPLPAPLVCGEGANLNPLMFYQPLDDYIYDRLRPHSPNYVRRL
jgi:hypothetical protein